MPKPPTPPSHAAVPPRGDSPLTTDEVQAAYADYRDRYPPIVTLVEAAAIARLKPSTLKRKVSEGSFKGCVRKGKPLLFWRDRFIQQFMRFGR